MQLLLVIMSVFVYGDRTIGRSWGSFFKPLINHVTGARRSNATNPSRRPNPYGGKIGKGLISGKSNFKTKL